MIIFAYLTCFVLGAFTVYMDIHTFFSEKRIGVANIFKVASADFFMVLNGVIGLGFLLWSLSSPEAKINTLLYFENPILKGLLIGAFIPILIRSKWFNIKNNKSSVGVEGIYKWVMAEVLYRVHLNSISQKKQIAKIYAKKLNGETGVPLQVNKHVVGILEPFKEKHELDELEKEYKRLEQKFANNISSIEHLEDLFVWAMDNAGISPIKKFLRTLEPKA